MNQNDNSMDVLQSYLNKVGLDKDNISSKILSIIDQDTILSTLLLKQKDFQKSMMHCFLNSKEKNDVYQYCFRCLFCLGTYLDTKFPVSEIIKLQTEVNNHSSQVYKVNWNGSLDLECLNCWCNEEYFSEDKKQIVRNIQFVIECRRYSKHSFLLGQFFYQFQTNLYEDRIPYLLLQI